MEITELFDLALIGLNHFSIFGVKHSATRAIFPYRARGCGAGCSMVFSRSLVIFKLSLIASNATKIRFVALKYETAYEIGSHLVCTQQTQNICIKFVQRRPNVFDVGPTLYKWYTNVLWLLGSRHRKAFNILYNVLGGGGGGVSPLGTCSETTLKFKHIYVVSYL